MTVYLWVPQKASNFLGDVYCVERLGAVFGEADFRFEFNPLKASGNYVHHML
jgi:hypothetical protein